MSNIKDTLTTILGLVIVVAVAVKQVIDSTSGGDINWVMLIFAAVTAVIAYFTGKNPDGSKKVNPTIQ